MKNITLERLRYLASYDPETGLLIRINGNKAVKGRVVGHLNRGYWRTSLDGTTYLVHRLAWFYVHGVWPDQIDHINGDRTDNRIANLRSVTALVNVQNRQRACKGSASGLLGVYPRRYGKPWVARICVDGKHRQIGRFDDKYEAYAAYLEVKRKKHEGCTI